MRHMNTSQKACTRVGPEYPFQSEGEMSQTESDPQSEQNQLSTSEAEAEPAHW